MRTVMQNKSILYTSILYLCGFFLFLEWLYPVKDITETNSLSIFIIYTFFCFFISLFQMKWWITFLLKGIGLLVIINILFFEQSFLDLLWLEALYTELIYNAEALFSQQWYYLTPLFRSVLFLILIWLISYLLHYWFVVMNRILLFVILTFVYITVLDTFTGYDADLPIVRTFFISFFALGIANFMKELNGVSIRFAWVKKTPVWLLPLIGIVLFSSIIGFAAPKLDPQWPDPVPFIQGTTGTGNGGGGPIQKVGYGEDDSRLGGSFLQDDTPVFQASVNEKQYWRIETKDVYTGKGWENDTKPDYQMQEDGLIDLATFTNDVETKRHEAVLHFQGNTSIKKLIYPYGLHQVTAGESEAAYFLDNQSEAIQTKIADKETVLDNYSMVYDQPSFAINKLQRVNEENLSDKESYYTQLPSSLPDRITELAEDIAAPYDNRYDRARAVERYFGLNGFEYKTVDVPVPGKEDDYVDQFLFDSKVGYCDNYSTSMVVMLRALDIPARWAKGFTGGELIAENEKEEGQSVYEVTNANAHSWVEVYFPGEGWVPFEPTQGFSNLSDFHADPEGDSADSEMDDRLDADSEETDDDEEKEEKEEETASKKDKKKEKQENDQDSASIKGWHIAVGIAFLILLTFIIYKTRFRWQTWLLARKLNQKQNAETYQEAYHHLLKVLQHYGFTKETDQTLSEFAKRIDTHYQTDEMMQLTIHFEQVIYRNKVDETEINRLTKLWQDLIKRVMG